MSNIFRPGLRLSRWTGAGEACKNMPSTMHHGARMNHWLTEDYVSPSKRATGLRKVFPSLFFYPVMIRIVLHAASLSRKGRYDSEQWVRSSRGVLSLLESVGVRVDIRNVRVLKGLDTPCVFIGNHMSTLETFVLPCILQPYRSITYVIKRSLIEYPVFKHVMISRDPIVIDRANPREDFKNVMEEGEERISRGFSVIVFPQATRSVTFDPAMFNSMGIKLARRCSVPVVPIALKTDAWGNGRLLKDFGRIDSGKTVHFAFGDPIRVRGSGKEEHARVARFIREQLGEWSKEERPGPP
jgi:1-acyl-sn-glycerol-3-phosphate acyltransferase